MNLFDDCWIEVFDIVNIHLSKLQFVNRKFFHLAQRIYNNGKRQTISIENTEIIFEGNTIHINYFSALPTHSCSFRIENEQLVSSVQSRFEPYCNFLVDQIETKCLFFKKSTRKLQNVGISKNLTLHFDTKEVVAKNNSLLADSQHTLHDYLQTFRPVFFQKINVWKFENVYIERYKILSINLVNAFWDYDFTDLPEQICQSPISYLCFNDIYTIGQACETNWMGGFLRRLKNTRVDVKNSPQFDLNDIAATQRTSLYYRWRDGENTNFSYELHFHGKLFTYYVRLPIELFEDVNKELNQKVIFKELEKGHYVLIKT